MNTSLNSDGGSAATLTTGLPPARLSVGSRRAVQEAQLAPHAERFVDQAFVKVCDGLALDAERDFIMGGVAPERSGDDDVEFVPAAIVGGGLPIMAERVELDVDEDSMVDPR